ncbi:centrosomal protein POC5-like isoform X2 [Symsagittifera roscoffensis]|uniref:centrosomal protein POC5-like isoform X2 n=1 Tax=Symsagittifera roscoffensis TaxID=84072 RepID=UPI00307B6691
MNDSRGSSISSTMKNDYDELMKFVNIVPENILGPDRSNAQQQKFRRCSTENSSVENWLNDVERIDRSSKRSNNNIHLAGDAMLAHDRNMNCESRHTDVVFTLHRKNKLRGDDSTSSNGRRTAQSYQHTRSNNGDTSSKCLELSLDKWCLDMKSMVMENFSTWRMSLLEQQKTEHEQTKKRFRSENEKYLDEIDTLKDQVLLLREDIAEKDRTIEGLQTVVNKQSELLSKSKIMFKWKNEMEAAQREQMCMKMAELYHNRKLIGKYWANWHCLIENKWRERVEKACQLRAQEICHQLEEKYQHQMEEMQKGLEESRLQIEAMQDEKQQYEENMRQAFLRGLSALNQEAHTIFHTPRSQQPSVASSSIQNINYASVNSANNANSSQNSSSVSASNLLHTRSVDNTPSLGIEPFNNSFGLMEAVGSLVDMTPTLAVTSSSSGLTHFTHQSTAANHQQQQQTGPQYFSSNGVAVSNQKYQMHNSIFNHPSTSPPSSAPIMTTSSRSVKQPQHQQQSVAPPPYQPAIPGPPHVATATPRTLENGGVPNVNKVTSNSTSNVTSAVGGSIARRSRRTAIVERHSQSQLNPSSNQSNGMKSQFAPNLPAVKVKQAFR